LHRIRIEAYHCCLYSENPTQNDRNFKVIHVSKDQCVKDAVMQLNSSFLINDALIRYWIKEESSTSNDSSPRLDHSKRFDNNSDNTNNTNDNDYNNNDTSDSEMKINVDDDANGAGTEQPSSPMSVLKDDDFDDDALFVHNDLSIPALVSNPSISNAWDSPVPPIDEPASSSGRSSRSSTKRARVGRPLTSDITNKVTVLNNDVILTYRKSSSSGADNVAAAARARGVNHLICFFAAVALRLRLRCDCDCDCAAIAIALRLRFYCDCDFTAIELRLRCNCDCTAIAIAIALRLRLHCNSTAIAIALQLQLHCDCDCDCAAIAIALR
jgi:hypothetical protein